MKYFIKSVSTLTSTGKSRKGATLQAIVKPFEHKVLCGDDALNCFVSYLRGLVAACNASYRGKLVTLHYNAYSRHIYATNENNGQESYIFSLDYAPVGEELCFFDIAGTMIHSAENLCGGSFAEAVESSARTFMKKGGEQ